MTEAYALMLGFAAIYGALLGFIWISEFGPFGRILITITTTIWVITSSIAVMNGVPA